VAIKQYFWDFFFRIMCGIFLQIMKPLPIKVLVFYKKTAKREMLATNVKNKRGFKYRFIQFLNSNAWQ